MDDVPTGQLVHTVLSEGKYCPAGQTIAEEGEREGDTDIGAVEGDCVGT